jgi:pSer/pThr/pTyr-binding forkhead associated (FHA) protein/ribosomal protein L40E
MNLELGVVCGECDAYSPMGTTRCPSCGHDLALDRSFRGQAGRAGTGRHAEKEAIALQPKGDTLPPSAVLQLGDAPPMSAPAGPLSEQRRAAVRPQAPEVLPVTAPSTAPKVEVVRRAPQPKTSAKSDASWGPITTGKIPVGAPVGLAAKGTSKEELMDQAKNYVCRSCSTPIPSGHKFCGRCGAAVPPDILTLREEFYGSLQVPGRAKLILIRAEGDAAMEGLSFALNAQEHIVGRQGHLTFPEDRFVSPKHANLFYRDGALVVRDEGSLNGVFVRVRGTVDLQPGDMFLAGEQVFRVDPTPKASDHPEPDGTYFWSSPKRPSPFRVVQLIQGGAAGNVVCARETGVAIGREGGEMNFPQDVYMSATHCKVEADPSGAKFTLTDLNSRNGTYLRMRGERELHHGDYVFIGKKILRVEVTS